MTPIFFVITKTPPLILYLYVFYYYGKNILLFGSEKSLTVKKKLFTGRKKTGTLLLVIKTNGGVYKHGS